MESAISCPLRTLRWAEIMVKVSFDGIAFILGSISLLSMIYTLFRVDQDSFSMLMPRRVLNP